MRPSNVYRLDPSFWKAMVFKHRTGLEVLKAPPPALYSTVDFLMPG
ncbi:MAG: hypothetical protein U5J83_02275 [Bryobacterales bacterium]|nr:hypothetical protein [Bryobacterales bacterium]